jgi:two-component system, chemotaxis family, chemotaxis protein CheY
MFTKVYIIDDDEVTLYLTGLVLSLYAPDSCSTSFQDGAEALAAIQLDAENNQMPSLILLDLNMPVMNGFRFLEELDSLCTALADKPQLYILTSSLDKVDKIACLQHKLVLDVIEKPLTEEKLYEIEKQISSLTALPRT